MCLCFFFFNDTATTEIYTLSLHDALPIWQRLPHQLRDPAEIVLEHLQHRGRVERRCGVVERVQHDVVAADRDVLLDRKSTRLNSSHANISYAVFCLKKKKNSTPLLYYTTK